MVAVLPALLPLLSDADQESSRIRFTPLDRSDGLSSNRILDIEQDLTGWVWLATDRGLNKFDGFKTIEFRAEQSNPNSLSSNKLTCLAQANSGEKSLWIGTSDAGLNRLDPVTEQITVYDTSRSHSKALLSDSILQLAVTGDKFLWIGTSKGLNVMNLMTQSIRAFKGELENARITCIRAVSEEESWVGTAEGGLYRWSPADSDFSRVWSGSAPITSIISDSRNEMWIGTQGMGLYRYTPGSKTGPIPSSLQAKDISSIFNDSNGDLWVGTTQGLARLQRGAGSFTLFVNQARSSDSLPDNHIHAIFEGQARMLWVATENGGLGRFSLDRYWFPHIRESSISESGLPHSSIWGMSSGRQGTVWIGTEAGLGEWIPEENFINLPLRGKEFSEVYTTAVYEDSKGRLWVGTKGEGLILRLQDGSITRFRNNPETPPTIGHNYISAIHETEDNQILIGTWGAGVFEYEEASQQFRFAPMVQGNSPQFVTQISQDEEKHIWIASREGLFVLPNAQKTILEYREAFEEAGELSSNAITSIRPGGNGILWVGTEDSGLNRLRIPGGETQYLNSNNSDLPDDAIRSLLIDNLGILWIATRLGISRYHTANNRVRNFGVEDGLQKNGYHRNSAAIGADGKLYFGGVDGFNIVNPDPATLPQIEQLPTPVLTGFEYFGERVKPGPGKILEKPIASAKSIDLPYDKRNRFAIQFANLDYRFPDRGFFRYKLDNFEFEWNTADDSRKAAYPSLQPGSYRFHLQTSADGKNWSENEAQVDIIISPPFWKTWWARVGAFIFAIVGTVFTSRFFIRSRTELLQRREEKIRSQRDRAEAALARELQNSLLIERATREFHASRSEGNILTESLKGLADRFDATQCLVHHIRDDGEGAQVLKLIGSYSAEGYPLINLFPLDPEQLLIRQILQSDQPYFTDINKSLPDDLRENLDRFGAQSMLTVRTNFNDTPNGLITLLQTKDHRIWDNNDTTLLNALSPQFGMAIAQLDLSEKEEIHRTQLEESRKNAEIANIAKTDFLAKMTHELRTPLNAIIGFSEMIQEDKTLGSRQRQMIDIVNNSGEHLLDVINDILDVSKIEAGKAEKKEELFELSTLLRSVYEMLRLQAKTKEITLEIVAETSLPGTIKADRSKLRQTLINLLNNAIKFTEDGGTTLSVKASALGEPEEIDGKMSRPVRVHFEIRDTGIGISEEDISKLFKSYSQTESGKASAEGTGLGLTIAKSFVELMGGKISVESTVGEGTAFGFYIDCSEFAPGEGQTEDTTLAVTERNVSQISGHVSNLDPVRILIAEDQPTNRLLLRKILEKAGFSVEEAHNGEDAVDRWRTWNPHLIFMDEDMPIMRGSEATRLIKSETDSGENNPIIVSLTAYAMDQARQLAMDSGSQDFVAKPFKSHELYSVISKHLEVDYIFDEVA